MPFRPVDRLADEDNLGQGGGGGPANVTDEAGPTSSTLDDVFGAEAEPDPTSQEMPESPGHPSDMHRLETEHETAGYRDGIAAGREQTVQAGFDDGFNIGSAVGLAAGQLLGMMEGIEDALEDALLDKPDEEFRRNALIVSAYLKEAEQELNEVYLLSDQFWGPQGRWSDEVDLSRLVRAHPMIIKWSEIVRDLARLVNMDLLAFFAYVFPEAEDDATATADDATVTADDATATADDATAASTGTATLALRPHASLDW
ncbi:hypothetical protein ACQKWADRAFT_169738 [Trichoderma austrokoningii]